MGKLENHFIKYLVNLYEDVPLYLYVALGAISYVGVILLFVRFGRTKGLLYSSRLLLLEYLFLLFCSTIFFRADNEEYGPILLPFWSYVAIPKGSSQLIAENIMNVLAFVPIGFLFGCAFRRVKWRAVLFIGLGLSVAIEVLQFVFKKGFSETDDIMHNVLGCMIGYGIFSLIKLGYEKHNRRHIAVL